MNSEYEFALGIAFQDMGIYCQSTVGADGVEKKRTEWQDGWNAYATELNDAAGRVMKFFSGLSGELRKSVQTLWRRRWRRLVL